VLNYDKGIALVPQPIEDFEQGRDVRKVETCRRFVKQVDGPAGRRFPQLGGELDPLRLSARQGRGGLSEADVTEPDVPQSAELLTDLSGIFVEEGRAPRRFVISRTSAMLFPR